MDDEEQGFVSSSPGRSRVSSFFTAWTLSKRQRNKISSLTTAETTPSIIGVENGPSAAVAAKKVIPSAEYSNGDNNNNNNNTDNKKEERGQLLNNNDINQNHGVDDVIDDDNDDASLLIKDHLSKNADNCVYDDDDDEIGNDENTGFIVSSNNNANKKKPNNKDKNIRRNRNRNNNNNNNNSNIHFDDEGERYVGERHFLSFLNNTNDTSTTNNIFYKTLFPDNKGIYFCGYPLIDNNNNDDDNDNDNNNNNNIPIKLLKFIGLTFLMIGVVHLIVAKLFNDRDRTLTLTQIWIYEGDLIVRDCIVFFLVGRLYKKSSIGIDHISWIGTAVLANIYFESQNFVWFLQHSVSLYEIHCIWPWELWLFAILLIPTIGIVVILHIVKGYREKTICIKITEMILCILFFVAPMITSKYFHLHHWYAGWLLGMHANYNTWWSRMAMAWCWGMYVNGIAVYGRDPVLTCEYSYFLTLDNRCPYISCYLDALQDKNQTEIKEMVPINWMNCSASDDYKP